LAPDNDADRSKVTTAQIQALLGASKSDLQKLLGQPDAKKTKSGNEVWTYHGFGTSPEGAKLDQNFLIENDKILFDWQEEPK